MRRADQPRPRWPRAVLFGLAILVALPAVAEAARDDDFDFAEGLVRLKYYDLAKEQFERIIGDTGRSGAERANGELGLALLLKAQAADMMLSPKSETDATLALFDEAETRFDKFLSNNPSHPKRTDARFEVGLLLQAKGTFLSGRADKEPDKAESLKSAAEGAFDQAVDLFKGVADALEERLDDMSTADLENPRAQMMEWNSKRARFYESVCHYNKGILYEEGGAEREGTLKNAIELLTDFVWDNEDNILGAYAYLYLGLAKKALNLPDEAIEFLKVVCTSYPVPDPNDVANFATWTDLYLQGYYKLAEYCAELAVIGDKDYRDIAITELREMDKVLAAACWERKFGHLALLQFARCYMGLGEYDKAMDLATRVSLKGEELATSTEWGPATAYTANRLLTEIIAEAKAAGKDIIVPPDVMLKAALGKMATREWGHAIGSFQGVVQASKTPEEVKEYAIPAWMKIGECYYRQEKFLEAFFAYDSVVKSYRKVDKQLAGDAAYYRYRAATALYAATRDAEDEKLKKKARSSFAGEFPKHPRSIDLQYYEGADYIVDGDALMAAKETGRATDTYNLALDRLKGVKKSSILFSKAKARIGEIYYKLGKYAEAQKMFDWVEKHVADPDNVTTDRERTANRLQARALGTYYSALCYMKQKRWDKLLARIKDYETIFADENVKNFHSPVRFERIRALLKMNNLKDAETEYLALQAADPESSRIPLAAYLLGMAFFDSSEDALTAKNQDLWKEHLTKAADYFAFYVTGMTAPKSEDYESIGIWRYKLNDLERAAPNLNKALEMLTAKLDALEDKRPENPEFRALTKKIEGITVMLSEILLKSGKFAEAKKFFEDLLIPNADARERVMTLLKQQEHTRPEFKELMGKIRRVPSFMEGYARVLHQLGGLDDCLRALTLLRVLSTADKSNMYQPDWWEWQYLTFQVWLELGVNHGVQQALDNIKAKYQEYDGLGVLERSGRKPEFLKIKQMAR